MKKPSQYYFDNVGTEVLPFQKDHDHEFIKISDLISKLSKFTSDTLVEVSFGGGYINNRDVRFTLFKRKEVSKEEFAEQMAEFNLSQKLSKNKVLLNEKQKFLADLKKQNSSSEELIVLRKRLSDIVGNDKIPPLRKEQLVTKLNLRIKTLDSNEDTNVTDLISDVKKQIHTIENDISFQQEIIDLNAKALEVHHKMDNEDKEYLSEEEEYSDY
jgi:hypothetical protein